MATFTTIKNSTQNISSGYKMLNMLNLTPPVRQQWI